jgi:hypothetical protein
MATADLANRPTVDPGAGDDGRLASAGVGGRSHNTGAYAGSASPPGASGRFRFRRRRASGGRRDQRPMIPTSRQNDGALRSPEAHPTQSTPQLETVGVLLYTAADARSVWSVKTLWS